MRDDALLEPIFVVRRVLVRSIVKATLNTKLTTKLNRQCASQRKTYTRAPMSPRPSMYANKSATSYVMLRWFGYRCFRRFSNIRHTPVVASSHVKRAVIKRCHNNARAPRRASRTQTETQAEDVKQRARACPQPGRRPALRPHCCSTIQQLACADALHKNRQTRAASPRSSTARTSTRHAARDPRVAAHTHAPSTAPFTVSKSW